MAINYRDEFPIYKNNKDIIYLDSACTTLIPESVLNSVNTYYLEYSGCHGRGGHLFGDETTKRYEKTREKIQKLINASSADELIFTKNTTEGINIIANTFPFKSNDHVLTSDIEHNSNLLPWQELSFKKKIKHVIFSTSENTLFDLNKFKEKMDKNVKLVSIIHVSNLSGITFPLKQISEIVHENGAYLMVDAAQSLSCLDIDVQKIGIDFLVSSMHKNFGPSGVGFLYIKKELHDKLDNFIVGGETVSDVTFEYPKYESVPKRYEAGLQNYAGIIAGGEAVDFINRIGVKQIREHKLKLNKLLTQKIKTFSGISLIGPEEPELRNGICNFTIKGIDPFDAVKILSDSKKIMIRAGYHCVHAWYHKNEISASLRISIQIYNTENDINILINSIKYLIEYFR